MLKHTFTFMFTAAVMAAFCGASLQAQIPDRQRSLGTANGRLWLIMPEDGKLGYAIGYSDHDTLAAYQAKSGDTLQFPGTLSYGEIRKAVTLFYDEPENLDIPVWGAFHVVNMKLSGATREALDAWIANARSICKQERDKEAGKLKATDESPVSKTSR